MSTENLATFQDVCEDCFFGSYNPDIKATICMKDNRVHRCTFDCIDMIPQKEVHERAERLRRNINSMNDEQLLFFFSVNIHSNQHGPRPIR